MNYYAKIILLGIGLVFFTSAALYVSLDHELENTLREELLSNVTHQSTLTISNIESFVHSRLNDIKMAAQNPIFADNKTSQETLTKRLQELENINDIYHSFSLYDSNRLRIADSKGASVGKTDSYRSYWTLISREIKAVVDISKSESIGKNVMHFAAAISGDSPNFQKRVLVGHILIDELYGVLKSISLKDDGGRKLNTTLVGKNGIVLYSDNNQVKALQDKYDNFETIIEVSGKSDERVVLHETEKMLYFIARSKNYLNSSGEGWTLVVNIPKRNAFLPLHKIQSKLVIVVLTILGIAVIFTLIFANILVKPIVTLSKAAEQMSKGNLKVDIPVHFKDEVGKLANQLRNTSRVLLKRINQQRKLNKQLEIQKNKIHVQKQQLEHANEHISDSIVYARRIQRSILPDKKIISRIVSDSFVLYEPKDVVSGDFYWFERVRQGRHEYLIIACADCTGHGVPGAIMSIMGSNQITNIVYYQNYIDPNKILARLDKVIKFELKRDEGQNQDGMEIGLCVINLDDLKMEFSGAGIPLYIVKKGTKELITYKSAKHMVGGMEGDEKEAAGKLKKEEIQLEEGDKIYLSSDGFQDQFGGEKDKKFMSKQFKTLLEQVSDRPMHEQATKIKKTFLDWKGNTEQTDDVLVIGIEI